MSRLGRTLIILVIAAAVSAVLSEEELGVAVKLVGIGEGIDDLNVFDPSEYLSALLRSEDFDEPGG